MTIDKSYQPLELEKKWYHFWESHDYFSPKKAKETYCIMLPPPNVTGTLHMGHAFQDTIMDALIRYHRMKGYQTLWQGGTDHAGIATQMVVERQLQAKGSDRHQLGREAFVEKVWEWKAQSGDTISRQMRRLGASIDWSRERFTMDEGLSEAVTEVFVRLYDEGLIYRGKRLVNWDPKLHTAISDLEVISEEEDGFMWHIRYPIANSHNECLVVATTRPETMLGDTAVAVHPDDSRYQHLIGQQILLPLTNRLIPIIADDYVDPTFGTGCVKITPAHDFNDHEIGKRHGLAMINIFTIDAILNSSVPAAYQGLSRFVARERIVKDLEKAHLLEKVEPHRLKIPRGDRSGEIVEPYLTNQWFVNVKPLAQKAIEAVKSKKIEFVPENWEKTYFDWMENIQDWCISRQLWWGHRICAWYDNEGDIYVARTKEEAILKYNLSPSINLEQESDVLDTWFSSALWPFSTLHWPADENEISTYYPTNVLVTGFDIIFFWVARMIMMGLKFTDDVPFRQVYVHGLIQDAHGQKMSKSKGNVLDPIDIIDGISLESLVTKRVTGLMQPQMAKQIEAQTRKEFPEGIASFGTDALRFTFAALASNNRFIRFDLARVDGNRNFCNKLWNASRYVFMNLEEQDIGQSMSDRELTVNEKWIWSIWQKSKKSIHENFKNYRFDMVAQTLYEFIWNHYCDWYLEISKPTLKSDNEKICKGSRFTLVAILEELLRAIHPIMPFISEEIWQKVVPILGITYFKTAPKTIMLQPYPEVEQQKIDDVAEKALEVTQQFIVSVRTIRSEMNLHPSQKLVVLCNGEGDIRQIIEEQTQTITKLAKIESLSWLEKGAKAPEAASTLIGDIEVLIPLAGLINKEDELKRLTKEMEKLKKDIEVAQGRLNNPSYVNKAPKDVVQKMREHLASCEQDLAKLNTHYEKIAEL